MKVNVEVQEIELDGDYGPVDGVCVTCTRCGHQAEVFGTSVQSVRRGCIMLRDECPEDESNYYVSPVED